VTACPKMLEQLPEVKRFYPPSYEISFVIMALIYIVARGGKSDKE